MNTILKFSVELEELVGRKWQIAPNRMFQQLTDKTKKKKKHRPFYEAVDAHARRRLIITRSPQGLYNWAACDVTNANLSPFLSLTFQVISGTSQIFRLLNPRDKKRYYATIF